VALDKLNPRLKDKSSKTAEKINGPCECCCASMFLLGSWKKASSLEASSLEPWITDEN
jgi:hypothetical protein